MPFFQKVQMQILKKSPEKNDPTVAASPIRQNLGFWDSAAIIVGIVIGTAIFRSPTSVFQNVSGPWQALGAWLLGGVLCLIGALCYAELATTYPRNGGDYEYLSRAYGRWLGFLFGWAQLAVVLTSSIGMMAYIFADYSATMFGLPAGNAAWIAIGVVGGLSAVNLLGVAFGKTLQNVLSGAKVLGLLGIVLAGVVFGQIGHLNPVRDGLPVAGPGFGVAMVFVLYAFGGWSDAVFVAAEVRQQRRNLPWALFWGIAAITAVYLAVNASYLAVLGFAAARATLTPATDTLLAAGAWGGTAVGLLVMLSTLGAINGMIFAGSRVYAVVGEDHRAFALLGRWNRKSAVPVAAIAVQAVIAMAYVAAVGTGQGREIIDDTLGLVGLGGLPWKDFFGGFETLLAATAPTFWTFFLLTGASVVVLRLKDGQRRRPFRVPLYPLPPLVFCATCGYMIYSSAAYAKLLSLLGLAPLLLGLPVYWVSEMRRR